MPRSLFIKEIGRDLLQASWSHHLFVEYTIVQRVVNKSFISQFLWRAVMHAVILFLSFKPSEEGFPGQLRNTKLCSLYQGNKNG